MAVTPKFDIIGCERSGDTPREFWYEIDREADGKLWDLFIDAGVLSIRTRTDADGTGATCLSFTRSGTSVSAGSFGAPLTITSGLTLSDRLTVTGIATFGDRVQWKNAADAASSSTLTLASGNVTTITGTTTINQITTSGWSIGAVHFLYFTAAAAFAHAQTPSGQAAAITIGSAGTFTARTHTTAVIFLTSTATVPTWRLLAFY